MIDQCHLETDIVNYILPSLSLAPAGVFVTLWALTLFFFFFFFFFFRYFADKGKMSKFSKVITQKIFFSRIYPEVNQVIYSFILPINLPSFKALAPTVFFFFFFFFFCDFADKRKMLKITKGHN